MFFGHVAIGLTAKPAAPEAPLGALLLSATALDALWGVFAIAGFETMPAVETSSIPWSHGLLMAATWALAAFGLATALTRDRRTSLVVGLLVLSHWALDFLSLPAVLPLLFEGSPEVGLDLYASPAVALITELGLLALGILIYLRRTTARDRIGRWAIWLLVGALVVLAAPAATPELALLPALVVVILLPLGNWVDRHRSLAAA